MRELKTVLLVIFLTGCGIGQVQRKVNSPAQNSLVYESLSRLPQSELEELYENKNLGLFRRLVKCHIDKKLSDENKKTLRQKLAKHRENPKYWTVLGGCALIEKKYSLVKFYYDLAKTKLSNTDPFQSQELKAMHLSNLAFIDMKFDHPEQAYVRTLKSHKLVHSRTALFNLAFLNLYFARLDKAERQFKALKKQAPRDPDILVGLSVLEILRGKPKKSLEYFQQIPDLYSERADIAIYRAMALYENKELEKAYLQLSHHDYTTNKHLRSMADPLKKSIAQILEDRKSQDRESSKRLPAQSKEAGKRGDQ